LIRRPEKAVVRAGRAAQELRVGQHAVAHAILAGIFALRIHIGVADIDRADFVHADAAGENFFRLPAAVSKNHWPSCFTSGMGNGQPSAPISSVTLESELFDQLRLFRQVLDEHFNSSVAWTHRAKSTHVRPAPKIECMAFVS
jgi:hypothetical protein